MPGRPYVHICFNTFQTFQQSLFDIRAQSLVYCVFPLTRQFSCTVETDKGSRRSKLLFFKGSFEEDEDIKMKKYLISQADKNSLNRNAWLTSFRETQTWNHLCGVLQTHRNTRDQTSPLGFSLFWMSYNYYCTCGFMLKRVVCNTIGCSYQGVVQLLAVWRTEFRSEANQIVLWCVLEWQEVKTDKPKTTKKTKPSREEEMRSWRSEYETSGQCSSVGLLIQTHFCFLVFSHWHKGFSNMQSLSFI